MYIYLKYYLYINVNNISTGMSHFFQFFRNHLLPKHSNFCFALFVFFNSQNPNSVILMLTLSLVSMLEKMLYQCRKTSSKRTFDFNKFMFLFYKFLFLIDVKSYQIYINLAFFLFHNLIIIYPMKITCFILNSETFF